jgi:hypothetical protein
MDAQENNWGAVAVSIPGKSRKAQGAWITGKCKQGSGWAKKEVNKASKFVDCSQGRPQNRPSVEMNHFNLFW